MRRSRARASESSTTLQRLPFVNFVLIPRELASQNLHFSLDLILQRGSALMTFARRRWSGRRCVGGRRRSSGRVLVMLSGSLVRSMGRHGGLWLVRGVVDRGSEGRGDGGLIMDVAGGRDRLVLFCGCSMILVVGLGLGGYTGFGIDVARRLDGARLMLARPRRLGYGDTAILGLGMDRCFRWSCTGVGSEVSLLRSGFVEGLIEEASAIAYQRRATNSHQHLRHHVESHSRWDRWPFR